MAAASEFGVFLPLKGHSLEPENLFHQYAPVGRAFFTSIRGLPKKVAPVKKEPVQAVAAEDEGNVDGEEETIDEDNYYKLLGLGILGFKASQKQIKNAYRKAILKHHPDKKVKTHATSDTDPMFLKIQKAHDVLSDEKKRRGYDSQLDFDDHIPNGRENLSTGVGFYGLYGPIFDSNSRFSEQKPVPELGADDAEDDNVLEFYDFWMRFRSWRDFSANDEHDASEADSRDERRWMQQENERSRRKHKKEENERIRKLVERAQSNDPRMKRIKQKQREDKERKQQERLAAQEAKKKAKKEAEEMEAKRLADEKTAAELSKKQEKINRQREKKIRRKLKNKLVGLCEQQADSSLFDEDDVPYLCLRLVRSDAERLLQDCTALSPEVVLAAAAAFLAAEKAKDVNEAQERQAAIDRRAAEVAAKKLKQMRSWTEKELAFLAKGLNKFPGGTRHRWKHVAKLVNSIPSDRTPKECIGKANKIQASKGTHTTDGTAAFATFTKKAESVEKASPGNAYAWTPEQQRALQAGMKNKAFNNMSKKDRWNTIANAVPGKTLQECLKRVKQIRVKIMAAKAKR